MLILNKMISSNYENKFPDCLFVKLDGELVAESENYSSTCFQFPFNFAKSKSNNPQKITEQIELKLTIRFGEQQLQMDGITVNFGLKSGKLHLKFSNSKVLMETLGLTPLFQTVIEIESQTEQSQANEKSLEFTLRGGFTAKGNQVTKKVSKFINQTYQVYTKGTEEEISWIFQLKTSEPILQGILQTEKLGTLKVDSKPCQIRATFEIQDEDVQIIWTSGLWNQNIDRAKTALLEREFYYHFIKPQLTPYISRAELTYE